MLAKVTASLLMNTFMIFLFRRFRIVNERNLLFKLLLLLFIDFTWFVCVNSQRVRSLSQKTVHQNIYRRFVSLNNYLNEQKLNVFV